MKAEEVQRNKDDVGAKRKKERDQNDTIGDRLALLDGRLVALVDEALGSGKDGDGGGDEVHAEEDPRARPVQSAGSGEEQQREEGSFEEDAADPFEKEHGRVRAAWRSRGASE